MWAFFLCEGKDRLMTWPCVHLCYAFQFLIVGISFFFGSFALLPELFPCS